MNEERVYQVKRSHEVDWQKADLLSDFTFPWLEKETPRTEFRALYDEEFLHFQFDVDDDDIVLDEDPDRDKAVLGSDRVELFFSPTPDLSEPYYGIEMDPRGWVYDYEGRYHRQFDDTWRMPELEFTGEFFVIGYQVTGKIALSTLRQLNCLKGNSMITGVYRAEFSRNAAGTVDQNWIAWIDPQLETPDFHVPATFGTFEFVD